MLKNNSNALIKVFVVDDNFHACTLIREYLEDHFCDVKSYRDPNNIEIKGNNKLSCDVLVIDVRFGRDRTRGIDWVLEKQKDGQIDKSTLIIFISNFGNVLPEIGEKLNQVEQISEYEWFDKPIDLPSMWTLIKSTKGN